MMTVSSTDPAGAAERSLSGSAAWIGGGVGVVFGSLATWFHGGGPLFQALLLGATLFLILDLLLGIACSLGIRGEKLSSRKLNRFLMRLLQYGTLMVIAWFLDHVVTAAGGHEKHIYLAEIALLFAFLANDSTSVLEHFKEMEPYTGFKVPDFIGTKLHALQELSPERKEPVKERPGQERANGDE